MDVADEVRAGVLSGAPAIEQTVAGRDGFASVFVFPLFMSEGYFTSTAIPARLGLNEADSTARRGDVLLLPPLGVLPGLTARIEAFALAYAAKNGLSPGEHCLLLLGHGSTKTPRARASIDAHRRALAGRTQFAGVTAAYLEEPPFIADVVAASPRGLLAVGMFAGAGLHGGEDATALLRTKPDAHYAGPVVADSGIVDLIAATVAAAAGRRAARPISS